MRELKISAIREGTVIDHIPANRTFKVVEILDLDDVDNTISVASNLTSEAMGSKGIIKVGGKSLTTEEVDKIALIAPKATVNIIKDYKVTNKEKVNIQEEITNIVKCSNPNCVTNHEDVETKFFLKSKNPLKLKCHYCERFMALEDVELK